MPNIQTGEVDVVVLCGGLGTRLREVSGGLPKPMVPIQGRPFLEILIANIARQGFRRFILCVGYKAEVIKHQFTK